MCCHPFLCTGLEDDIADRQRLAAAKPGGPDSMSELQRLVHSSGKMVLLDKLLPKLRREGHKVSMLVTHVTATPAVGRPLP